MSRARRKRGDAEVLDWLEPRGLEKLRWVVSQQPRYRRPGMVTALLERAMPRRRTAPEEALVLAQTAVSLAVQLAGSEGRALEARSWAEVGNALRALQRFREAKAAFRRCEPLPETADEALLAEILSLRGSLDVDLGHHRKAVKAFRRSAEVYRGLARTADECRQVVKLGRALTFLGGYDEALQAHEEVINRLERESGREPLLLAAYGSAIWVRVEQGAAATDPQARNELLGEALAAVHNVRPFFAEFGTQMESLKLDWLFGMALGYDGKYGGAKAILRTTMERFASCDRPASAADVALDLAAVLLKSGHLDGARALGGASLQAFQEHEIEPHTWLALSMLRVTRDAEFALQLIDSARKPLRIGPLSSTRWSAR